MKDIGNNFGPVHRSLDEGGFGITNVIGELLATNIRKTTKTLNCYNAVQNTGHPYK